MSAQAAQPLPVVVLISGNGTNLQTLIDETRAGRLNIDIRAVISNRGDAYGLERALRAGIETEIIEHKNYPDRESFDNALAAVIDRHHPELVVLAGFMRILSDAFVEHYHGRMLNIHPSLLPKHRGLNTHQRALEAGDVDHGATIHYVTAELDGGPLIAQARVPVTAGDDATSLAARVHQAEYQLYPKVIQWIAEGRLHLDEKDQVIFDGRVLETPLEVELNR